MKKFISLASHPGKTGQYFYSAFFNHYKIDAVYEAHQSNDLKQSISNAIENGISGISITMPFKKSVISLLDDCDNSVTDYQSCNTIKILEGKLYGYNCDIEGVKHVSTYLDKLDNISILGQGAIGSMFAKFLKGYNYEIYSRSHNWAQRHTNAEIIINCTPYGTNTTSSPLEFLPANTKLVIDLAIQKNYLSEQCQISNVRYISGREFYKQQFLKQFEIYTGVTPNSDVYDIFAKTFYREI